MKHCILPGMQQCLRKGLGVFAQNASNLVGDSVMTWGFAACLNHKDAGWKFSGCSAEVVLCQGFTTSNS